MRRIFALVPMLAVAAVVTLGLQAGAGARQSTPAPADHPLVGSWQVAVSFEGIGPITVTNLITFGADGTVLAASGGQLPTLPAVAGTGLVLTEGHGDWTATGEQTADATFRYFTLDQSGGISSTNNARMTIDVASDGNGYVGTFSLDLTSPNGNSMGSGQGSLRAERIRVEPAASPVATPAA